MWAERPDHGGFNNWEMEPLVSRVVLDMVFALQDLQIAYQPCGSQEQSQHLNIETPRRSEWKQRKDPDQRTSTLLAAKERTFGSDLRISSTNWSPAATMSHPLAVENVGTLNILLGYFVKEIWMSTRIRNHNQDTYSVVPFLDHILANTIEPPGIEVGQNEVVGAHSGYVWHLEAPEVLRAIQLEQSCQLTFARFL